MNMKTLDIEQLLNVSGAEPRGTNDEGRQNDGTDITRSAYKENSGSGDYVNVHYSDSTYTTHNLRDGTSETNWDGYRP
jgi:hypothetical protein